MAGLLTDFDRSISDSNRIAMLVRRPAPATGRSELKSMAFQFPPKVVNNSRDADWDEKNGGPNAGDKIAVYKTANPLRITIEWRYVTGYAGWTAAKIKDEISTLRGYFRNPYIEGSGEDAMSPLVVSLLLWDIGGKKFMSFRITAVNVKHGPTLVGSKDGGHIFPLITDVSVELKSWPQILGTLGEKDNQPVQTVPGQQVFTPDWF